MAEVLSFIERTGVVEQQFNVAAQNTQMTVVASFGAVPSNLTFRLLVEQRLPGNEWSVVGGAEVIGLSELLGAQTSLTWKFSEQIVADMDGWESHRDVIIGEGTYKQLAFRPVQRLTVETSATLEYGVDIVAEDVAPPAFQFANFERR